MRLPFIWIALIFAYTIPYGPAFAQSQAGATSETGMLVTRRAASVNGRGKNDARATTWQFGQCVVARSPEVSAQITNLLYGSRPYKLLMDRLLVDECLSTGELAITSEIGRFAIFEGLYLRKFRGAAPLNFEKVTPIDYAAGYSLPLSAQVSNVVALGRFGDCVARADSQSARMLLLSLPDSMGERQAFAALKPKLGSCVPNGTKVAFSSSMLRGSVAEGLYRLSIATPKVTK